MREFEKYEMVKIKCPVCGCKNKVHTELLDKNNVFKGYSLKCCACGNYNRFLLNYEDNGNSDRENVLYNGKQRCIQSSFCPRKDCKLYGTSKVKNIDNGNNKFPNRGKQQCNENTCCNNIDIEVYTKPKFL